MDPIAKIIDRSLTETAEHTTKERLPFIERLRSAESHFPDFQHFGDEDLQRMMVEATEFRCELFDQGKPRWLSLIGNSGTGKTFLAEKVFRSASCTPGLTAHRELINPVMKVFWPKLLSQLRDGDYYRIRDLSDANFVFIDEIAVEHDPSGFGKDKLCELLSSRVNKWTVLTSNLTLEKLAQIDTRISSRMIRGGSVVVETNAMDFFLR